MSFRFKSSERDCRVFLVVGHPARLTRGRAVADADELAPDPETTAWSLVVAMAAAETAAAEILIAVALLARDCQVDRLHSGLGSRLGRCTYSAGYLNDAAHRARGGGFGRSRGRHSRSEEKWSGERTGVDSRGECGDGDGRRWWPRVTAVTTATVS